MDEQPSPPASDSSPERLETPTSTGDGEAGNRPRQRPSLIFLALVTLLTVAADLGSKWWIVKHFDPAAGHQDKIRVIENHVNLTFAKNKGGAFGMLSDEHEDIRKPFFLIISVAAIVFIVSLYWKLDPKQKALKWGLPLVFGGAIGNLVDRLRYKYVVDFIDIRLSDTLTWPTFNVADIAICVGVGLMALDMFSSRKKHEAQPLERDSIPESEPAPAGPPPAKGA